MLNTSTKHDLWPTIISILSQLNHSQKRSVQYGEIHPLISFVLFVTFLMWDLSSPTRVSVEP